MKKIFCILLSVIIILSLFVGCQKDRPLTPDDTKPETTAQPLTPPDTHPATTEAPATVATEPMTTEAQVPTTTEEVTTEPVATEAPTEPVVTEAPPAPSGNGSDLLKGYTWVDGVIVIDGVLYRTFDDPYTKMEENGWSFDLADYGKDDSYSLNAMEYVISTIHLYNADKYGKSYSSPSITIGIINTSNELKTIKSCWIKNIVVSGVSGFKTYEELSTPVECYSFELPSGLHRGSTLEEVKAAYGEPDDVYVADGEGYHYEKLTYKNDEEKMELQLTVYPESGLQAVEVNNNRQWKR